MSSKKSETAVYGCNPALLKFYWCRVDVLQSQIFLRSQISLAAMFVILVFVLVTIKDLKYSSHVMSFPDDVCTAGEGGGGTRPIFGCRWATEGLKPWPCLGQKSPKIDTLFRTTASILLPSVRSCNTPDRLARNYIPCLGQTHTKSHIVQESNAIWYRKVKMLATDFIFRDVFVKDSR